MSGSDFWGTPTVEVGQKRYDELLRQEALLDTIRKLHGQTSDYLFRDVVGYLFKAEVQQNDA